MPPQQTTLPIRRKRSWLCVPAENYIRKKHFIYYRKHLGKFAGPWPPIHFRFLTFLRLSILFAGQRAAFGGEYLEVFVVTSHIYIYIHTHNVFFSFRPFCCCCCCAALLPLFCVPLNRWEQFKKVGIKRRTTR